MHLRMFSTLLMSCWFMPLMGGWMCACSSTGTYTSSSHEPKNQSGYNIAHNHHDVDEVRANHTGLSLTSTDTGIAHSRYLFANT